MHLFLTQPRWEEPAMERAKQMYLSHYRSLPKSLERATADRIMAAMMGPDRWGSLSDGQPACHYVAPECTECTAKTFP